MTLPRVLPSLFDPPPPARRGEPTQEEAAAFISSHAESLRARVWHFIRAGAVRDGNFGATIEEISDALQAKQSTVCGRIDELRKLGLVEDSGSTRKTRAGVSAKVWRARAQSLLDGCEAPPRAGRSGHAV